MSLVFSTVPVARDGRGLDEDAPRTRRACSQDGWSLVMFAEGTRSRDGSVGRLRSGAAVLAAQHGLPLVPIHVSGHARGDAGRPLLDAAPAGRPIPRRHPIEIRFGAPIRPGRRAPHEVMERVRAFFEQAGAETTPPSAARSPAPPPPDVSRIFVTGASGFIGGALATRLLERGDELVGARALRRGGREARARAASRSPAATCSTRTRSPPGWRAASSSTTAPGINSHCPPDPELLLRGQRAGPGARGARRGARGRAPRRLTSSAASVGEPHGTVGDEDSVHRGSYLSVYDRSKHEGEQAAFAAAHRTGVEVVAVCPSSVQGPGRAAGNGKLIIDYVNGKLPAFVDTYVSVVDIADCTEAHLLAAERGRAGARYVLNGATITSAEALELIAELSGVRRQRADRPAAGRPLGRGAARGRLRASAAACRRCAARASARSCTATATTARWRRASSASTTRRSPRRSAARSSGRSPRGSSRGRYQPRLDT